MTDTAQVVIFIRGVDTNFDKTKELAALFPLKDTTKSRDLLEAGQSTLNRFSLQLNNLSGLATDGAPAMVGTHVDSSNIVEGKINDEQFLIEFESRLSRAERLLDEFEEIEQEMLVLDDKYNGESELINFENLFYKIISKARKIVNDSRYPGNANDNQSLVSDVYGGGTKIKLPPIPIANFDGSVENWYDDTPMLVDYHLDALLLFPNMVKESADHLRNMLDTMTETLLTLEKLDISVENWDPIVIHCLTKKFDDITFRCWEEKRPKGKVATLDEFKTFLNERVDTLKNIERNSKKVKENKEHSAGSHNNRGHNKWQRHKSFVNTESNLTETNTFSVTSQDPFCHYCKNKHYINNCVEFGKLRTFVRYEQAKKLGLCLNCLKKANHTSKYCKAGNCRKCGQKHNTMLHYDVRPNTATEVGRPGGNKEYDGAKAGEAGNSGGLQVGTSSSQALEVTQHVGSVVLDNGIEVPGEILLATALVQVMAKDGSWQTCRVLLDSGSQPNLITSELAGKLELQQDTVTIRIFGINQKSSGVSGRCMVSFKSLHNNFQKTISCLVVAKICGLIPSQNLNISQLDIPPHLPLADAGFGFSGKVDMLLGAEMFYSLLCVGQIKLSEFQPVLQKTLLGWILAGPMQNPQTYNSTMCNLNVVDIQNQLEKFWAVEEIPQERQSLSVGELEYKRLKAKGYTVLAVKFRL
ncbi:uncharacterized protein LOC126880951 [Diabrotica virgifera virgifera]|uniref:Peptidase aspartic putative domain-containing protein n=1 Tax=Diabrotica virgifera virgifera TaxID=50390 RepID=A0ABM5JSR8_DIAVI|nr:uncharacterized protein LOC126880951 [Diabrotica virgifera virgifera]